LCVLFHQFKENMNRIRQKVPLPSLSGGADQTGVYSTIVDPFCAGSTEIMSSLAIQRPKDLKFCPTCGSQNTLKHSSDQIDENLRVYDPLNKTLDEHQCKECNGPSFWI